jgi:large subunit ribosomal protein L4
VFGPQPRSYRLGIPKKLRQLARKSALNARAREGALMVLDPLELEKPRTKTLVELLGKLGVADRKVLLLTAGAPGAENVYLSGRNLPRVHVMRFRDVTAYEILWSDAVLVELPALVTEGGKAEAEAEAEVEEAAEGADA